MKIKGEVLHKGYIVPVEVEINTNWLGLSGVIVHYPKGYKYTDHHDLTLMVDFQGDLEEKARENIVK